MRVSLATAPRALVAVGLIVGCRGLAAAQVGVTATECVGDSGSVRSPSCDPEWSLKHTGFDEAGAYWALGSNPPKRFRWTLDLGFGF